MNNFVMDYFDRGIRAAKIKSDEIERGNYMYDFWQFCIMEGNNLKIKWFLWEIIKKLLRITWK